MAADNVRHIEDVENLVAVYLWSYFLWNSSWKLLNEFYWHHTPDDVTESGYIQLEPATINHLHAQFIAFIYSIIIILNHFESFWIISNHFESFESFWIILNHFESFRIILNHFESVRIILNHLNHFESFRIILNHLNHFESFRIILNHFESFWIISNHFESFESFWIISNHFESFESFWIILNNDPKMVPKGCQNGAKMVLKWSQNGPKMVPKGCLNGPKMVPKWSRHASFERRHVGPSAVSLAGVYASPAKPALVEVWALPAPTGRLSTGTAILWILSIFTLTSWILTT